MRFTGYSTRSRNAIKQPFRKAFSEKNPRAEAFAAWVQAFEYVYVTANYGDYTMYDPHSAMSMFSNLRSLGLRNVVLTEATFLALANTPALRTVAFEHCMGSPTIASVIYSHNCKWTKVTLSRITCDTPVPHLIPTILGFIDVERLTQLSCDDWLVTSALLMRQSAPALQQLDVGFLRGSNQEWRTILGNIPSLVRLSVSGILFDPSLLNPDSLLPNLIPCLQELSAHPADIERLISHRDLSFLAINDLMYYDRPIMVASGRRLTNYASLLNNNAHNLTSLKCIKLKAMCAVEIVLRGENLSYLRTPLPSVTTVLWTSCETGRGICETCAEAVLSLGMQRSKLLARIRQVFPNALTLRICEAIEWRRTPGGDAWRPWVYNRALVRDLLMREDVERAQDVDGCLESALTLEIQARIGKGLAFTSL